MAFTFLGIEEIGVTLEEPFYILPLEVRWVLDKHKQDTPKQHTQTHRDPQTIATNVPRDILALAASSGLVTRLMDSTAGGPATLAPYVAGLQQPVPSRQWQASAGDASTQPLVPGVVLEVADGEAARPEDDWFAGLAQDGESWSGALLEAPPEEAPQDVVVAIDDTAFFASPDMRSWSGELALQPSVPCMPSVPCTNGYVVPAAPTQPDCRCVPTHTTPTA